MKKYKLYYHKNIINNKYYVGITCKKNINERWGVNGLGYKTQHFYYYIQKYGWNNFEHVILFDGLTKEDAIRLEQEYIVKFNSLVPNGYNYTKGGDMTFKNNGIICLETGEIFSSNDIDMFLQNHQELRGKYNEEDVLDCCRYRLRSLHIPYSRKNTDQFTCYHFAYNNIRKPDSPEMADRIFDQEVARRKYKNSKINYMHSFKKNGILKGRNICDYCGEIFTYNKIDDEGRKKRPKLCEKCKKRKIA